MTSTSNRATLEDPSDDRVVVLSTATVPPMTSYGVAIAHRTHLVAARDVALLQDSNAVTFENKTIAFPLDLIAGASFVPNQDNWGIGPRGVNAQLFWNEGARGQDIRIGIADSGIDLAHPTFTALKSGGRLAAFAEFDKLGKKRVQVKPDGSAVADDQATPTFSHWHGTHCAAIALGDSTSGKTRGVAPHSTLAVVRVLEQANEGSVAGIAAGLWWLVDQGCEVVSLSLGWPGLHEEWAEPVLKLLSDGAVVLAAVGNEFGLPGSPPSRSPANYPFTPSAATDGVLLRVGAHDESGAVWSDSGSENVDWSNVVVTGTDGVQHPSRFAKIPRFEVPDLVGPGVDIVSAVPNDRYFSSPGTSMATPHIAGIVALALSLIRQKQPNARPRDAAEKLLANLKPIAGGDARAGGGVVNTAALVAACKV